MNRSAVIEHVRRGRAHTRRDLSRLTGLSRSAVSQTVSGLVAEGLLTEWTDSPTDRPGRPSTRLGLVARPGWVAAIDVGHRHVAVAVSDLHRRVLDERSEPWSVDASAGETFALAGSMLTTALAKAGVRRADVAAVGVALPFPVSNDRVAPVGDVPGWADVRPARLLALPGGARVVVRNCSDLGAWGEYVEVAVPGVRSLVFADAGDGVGSALIVDGRLFNGTHGLTGEIGHVAVRGCDLRCRCGRTGCLDALVSVAAANPSGSPERAAAAEAMGGALAWLASFVDPDLVVLGGTLPEEDDDFFGRAREAYARREPLHRSGFVAARLGERAPLVGALDAATQEAWATAAVPSI